MGEAPSRKPGAGHKIMRGRQVLIFKELSEHRSVDLDVANSKSEIQRGQVKSFAFRADATPAASARGLSHGVLRRVTIEWGRRP